SRTSSALRTSSIGSTRASSSTRCEARSKSRSSAFRSMLLRTPGNARRKARTASSSSSLRRYPPSEQARRSEMTELATPPVEQEQQVKRISHWIGGRHVQGQSGRSGPVYNPAIGRQTGAVDFATPEEVDSAVRAAREAFPAWRAISLSKRTAIFFRI